MFDVSLDDPRLPILRLAVDLVQDGPEIQVSINDTYLGKVVAPWPGQPFAVRKPEIMERLVNTQEEGVLTLLADELSAYDRFTAFIAHAEGRLGQAQKEEAGGGLDRLLLGTTWAVFTPSGVVLDHRLKVADAYKERLLIANAAPLPQEPNAG